MTPTVVAIYFEISDIFRKVEMNAREEQIKERKWIIRMIIEGRKLMAR